MGSLFKKSLRLANKTQPHTWALGNRQSASLDLAGQAFGAHDRYYQPQDVEAPPAPNDSAAYAERDKIRRRAARAQGQPSTIRAGSLAQPYTGAPARLLGS